jgi:hypothetical protein
MLADNLTQGFFRTLYQGRHLVRSGSTQETCQNHLAERTWQTISSISRSLLVHACLPDTLWFQALCYATHIINVLPVCGLKNHEEIPATPHELFIGIKPCISSFRVFGCPSILQRWTAEERSQGKQTKRGMRGIFIGFDTNRKGYLFYMPGSRNIMVSSDAVFDETFHSTIATTWQQHHDTLALQPIYSYIPDITTTLEHTGTIDHNQSDVKEGAFRRKALDRELSKREHPKKGNPTTTITSSTTPLRPR